MNSSVRVKILIHSYVSSNYFNCEFKVLYILCICTKFIFSESLLYVVRVWLGYHGLEVGEVVGGVGQDRGQVGDHLVTYHHD